MRRILLALAVAAALPAVAQAQSSGQIYGPQAGSTEFTLSGTGSNDNDLDNGSFGVSGSLGYYFSRNLEAGVRQNFSYSDFADESNWNASTRAFVDYHLDFGRVRPFVGANIGYVYGDGVEETGIIGPEAGVKFYLSTDAFAFLQAEYQYFFDSGSEIEDNFDDGSFVYTVGFGLNF